MKIRFSMSLIFGNRRGPLESSVDDILNCTNATYISFIINTITCIKPERIASKTY